MKKFLVILMAMFLSASLVMPALAAIDYTGVKGVGIYGGLWAPMLKGSKISREPFAMGALGGLNFKYGLSECFVLNLGVDYAMTYDDTTTTDNATFKFFKKDNSTVKLTGVITEVTAQYYFLPESGIRPYVLGGVGANFWTLKASQGGGESTNYSDLVLKGGAGVEFALNEKMALGVGAKFNFLPAYISTPSEWTSDQKKSSMRAFQAYLEPGVNFSYYFGALKDSDHDGVPDKFDKCPDTPRGAIVDANGCPIDSDGDGVYDGLDQCPNTPHGCRVDVNGCPMDSDKDGVCDGVDQCPNTPAGVSVDSKGCPIDSDGDGVPDYLDKCPNTPHGCLVDANGCPTDSDNDGVCDGVDRCPNTPAGIAVDNYGCPLAKPLKEKIILKMQYKRGSVEPDAAAKASLDDIAQRMMAYPDVKLDINGYTDALGSAKANQKISLERAQAVMNYLISKGVPADRLTAKGMGETDFLVADKNSAENRRVELVPTM